MPDDLNKRLAQSTSVITKAFTDTVTEKQMAKLNEIKNRDITKYPLRQNCSPRDALYNSLNIV